MIHVHDLDGCAPAPLAHYLKALGILRLVAEQADPEARGWWDGERFRLATRFDQSELEAFFLTDYKPTALVAPWNKGSGFFLPDDPGLAPVEASIATRIQPLREGIAASRTLLDELATADQVVRSIKAEAKDKRLNKTEKAALKNGLEYKKRLAEAERVFKRLKADLIPRIRLTWRGSHREWMDAAMVLGDDGTPKFPALLGTGGNDGRLDFTNNFMQRLGEIYDLASDSASPTTHADAWIIGALWGNPIVGCQSGNAVGQYLPGMAGGANSGNGPDADSQLNPLDFILMLEGAVLFTAHATRRLGTLETSRAAAPFAVSAHGAGYASAASADESARGEQWMPLWGQPLTLAELRRLLAEGRAQIGARQVREPLDLARAVARLGTARGITAFQRYGYIERNGQSNLAVPIGRFEVPARPALRLACLEDLDAWLPRLRREAHDTHAPARLRLAERNLADAIFSVIQHPDERSRWQSVLLALAGAEAIHVHGGNLRAGPIPRLRPDWVQAADDGSVTWRLACALALQASEFQRDGTPIDSIRRHWVPAKNGETAAVMHARSGVADAIALVERRMIEAAQRGERRLPLVAARGASAAAVDLSAWLAGEVDTDRTLALARALMALDGKAWARQTRAPHDPVRSVNQSPTSPSFPDDAWLLIRLALIPWPLSDGRRIGADPAIFRRLVSGDAAAAVELAIRRLRAAGVSTAVRVAAVPPETARFWAAALAFPITRKTAERFLHRLETNIDKETVK
ncbi:MAG: type I-U CRISPR-associated protein Csx17 [Thiotrichales bacterium]